MMIGMGMPRKNKSNERMAVSLGGEVGANGRAYCAAISGRREISKSTKVSASWRTRMRTGR